MRGILGIHPGWGITAVRVAMAIVLIGAGWGKMNAGMTTVASNFEKMAIPMAGIAGPFIAMLELVGGTLLLLGIAGRWLGLLYTIEFTVAFFYVKLPAGFLGARLDLMLLTGGLLIFLAGPGRAAVDALWLETENRMRSRMMERAA
ncbi:MAG: hypothetical protein AUH30_21125 [Candidatus Rokubacteria bacterium 13_1_40CM_68_15]|nr:MAG: hypothetical protein AUH30_21125 [Candidatus Rokubacteria bacterium 13_1_40CM_68_15]